MDDGEGDPDGLRPGDLAGLAAVQSHILGLLDGLTSGQLPAAQAYITPPIVGDLVPAPQIYIWGGRIKEDRLTLPRPSGNKFLRHQVDVYPTLAMANDDPNLDTAFPALLDAIMETLRTTPIGIVITDPVTGGTSQLQNVGEEMSVDYATPQALADQAMLLFNGLITVIVDEFVIG